MSKPTGNPRGRPPLPPGVKRSARWSLRVTTEEKQWLEDLLLERRRQLKKN